MCVAVVDGLDDITIAHVSALLEAEDIDAWVLGGSVIYGIGATPSHYERAWRVLKEDSDRLGYWLELAGEEQRPRPPKKWESVVTREVAGEVMGREEFSQGTALGAIVRAPELSDDLSRYPYIDRLRTASQEHLSDDGKVHTGYWVVVELVDSFGDKPGSSSQRFQVYWAQGQWQVCYQGGSKAQWH